MSPIPAGIVASTRVSGANYLVSDSFNRANGPIGTADTGQAWTGSGATVVANQAKQDALGSNYDRPTHINCGVTDHTVSADISWNFGVPFPMLFVRSGGTGTYVSYRIELSTTTILLERLDNGAITTLGSAGAPSQSVVSRFSLTAQEIPGATRLTVGVNGSAVLVVDDSSPLRPNGTYCGFGQFDQGIRFDNFTVEAA